MHEIGAESSQTLVCDSPNSYAAMPLRHHAHMAPHARVPIGNVPPLEFFTLGRFNGYSIWGWPALYRQTGG
jgi:hypothetical protein